MTGEHGHTAPAKQTEILNVVHAHPDLQSLPEGRTRPVLIESDVTDVAHDTAADHGLVGLYDYARGTSRIALVDFNEPKVLAIEETAAQFQLSSEERGEAEELSAVDDRVTAFLGDREMNPLTRLYFPPDAPPDGASHRFAIVFLRPNSRERRYAIVDLTIRTVVGVLSPRDLTAE